jgi:hypothetical protein
MSNIRLQRGDHRQADALASIHADLDRAFGLGLNLGRPDATFAVGNLLAQVKAIAGSLQEALAIIDRTETAIAGSEQSASWSKHLAQLRSALGGTSDPLAT